MLSTRRRPRRPPWFSCYVTVWKQWQFVVVAFESKILEFFSAKQNRLFCFGKRLWLLPSGPPAYALWGRIAHRTQCCIFIHCDVIIVVNFLRSRYLSRFVLSLSRLFIIPLLVSLECKQHPFLVVLVVTPG